MTFLLLSLALGASSALIIDEEPIEVPVPKIGDKDDAATLDALAVIQKPASKAALHEAVKMCALLGVDAVKLMAAAKSGAADSALDERLLVIADGYLAQGDWVNAEKALRAAHTSAGVYERLGHALRAQKRFADAAKMYVAATDATSGPELDEILRRIEPVTDAWVADFEAGHVELMREVSKSVLTAMLPHQAGTPSELTKRLLVRLEAKPAGKPARSVLTASRLREAFAVQVAALRGCYARALVHEPTLKGKLVLNFSVEDGGKISSLRTTTNSTESKPLAACFETRFKALYLATETPVEVTYPFVFSPL